MPDAEAPVTAARLDPRVNAYRPDLADARLRGKVEARNFAAGHLMRVAAASAPLKRKPSAEAPYDSEMLRGEAFRVFADTASGWSWGQSQTDSYVGFIEAGALGPVDPAPTHRVKALRTFVYPKPDMKFPAVMALSFGSTIALGDAVDVRGTIYRRLAGSDHAVAAGHVEPIDAPPASDFVAVAERFVGVPYLWGGRTSLGVDCSALVQLSLMAAGIPAPRDTDMLLAGLGQAVEGGIEGTLRRGDLVFWPGHVAILTAPDAIVHASGYHLEVVKEPLADALARIGGLKGKPKGVKRPPSA